MLKKCLIAALISIGTATAASLAARAVQNPSPESPPEYRVSAYNGRVAVFEQDSAVPMQVLDMPVDALPAADRARLEAGISVSDPAELQSILEDYS